MKRERGKASGNRIVRSRFGQIPEMNGRTTMDSAGAIRVSPERSLQAGHSEGTGCFQGVAPPTPPDLFLLGCPFQKKEDPLWAMMRLAF